MPEPSDPTRPLIAVPHPLDATPSDAPSGTIYQATPSLAALDCPPSPLQVPGYEVLSELGRGGMGVVLKGRDLELGRDLAIKVLLEGRQSDEGSIRRFLEEAQIGGQLQHPGVVPVYEVGRLADHRPYFTMKLVEGLTLAALLKNRKSPGDDIPRFLKIFEQLCQTLAYAHARGVIHRDLKPLNIMVGAFGEVQVMDWGLAKVVKSGGVHTLRSEGPDSETTTGSVLGTPAYMAPEQACGDVEGLDERCDVFGLGAMLCEILTGGPPYLSHERGELLRQAARANLADAFGRLEACGADVELVRLAKACLAPEPADRPRNGAAAADAMAGYLSGVQERLRKSEIERAAAQTRAKEERKRRRLTVALAATVLLAATGAGAAALWYQQDRAAHAAEHARLAAERARRVADSERDVTAALDEAATLGAQARKLTDDPPKWEAALAEALSAVKRAEGIVNSGEGAEELRDRVGAVRADLEAAEKDRRMVALLEQARTQRAEAVKDGVDNAGAAALYATAFEQDMGLSSLPPEEAAKRINRRVIREDLLGALADWANFTANKDDKQRLRKLLQAADPDPTSFRNRLNALTAQKDWEGLRRLAFSPEALNQPTVRQASLGQLLRPADGVKFLRAATERHPSDFWLTFDLAYSFEVLTPTPAADEAIRYYTAAIALRPGGVLAHNNLGNVFRDKGRLDDALAEFNKAIELEPKYALAHYNLGVTLREKGRFDDALTEYRKTLELKPDSAPAHVGIGSIFHDKHQLDDAITEYRKAIELKSDYALAHCNLGNTLHDKGRDDEAIVEYHRAIDLKTDFALPHFNLGNVLHSTGRLDEAINEYHKAIDLNPQYSYAHTNLGNALGEKGQWDEAITEYRKAVKSKSDYALAHSSLSNAFRVKRQLNDALAESRIAVGLSPDDAQVLNAFGLALRDKGQTNDALAEFRKAAKADPKYPFPHYYIAAILRGKGEMEEAIHEYQAAIALNTDYVEAHVDLGGVLTEMGRLDNAIAEYHKAIELRPEYAVARANLGFALRKQGRFSESLGAFRRAHDLGIKDGAGRDPSVEWVHTAEELVRLDALLSAFLKKEAEPSSPMVGLQVAKVCYYKGRYEDSVRFFSQAFHMAPDLGDDLASSNRYDAACAAALGGCGMTTAGNAAEEKDRVSLRGQALTWLRSDLKLWTKKIADNPKDRGGARLMLQHWLIDPALAGVRDKDGLSKLTPDEQAAWPKLWAEVEVLLKKTEN